LEFAKTVRARSGAEALNKSISGQALRDDGPVYYGHPTIFQLESGLGIVLLGGRWTLDG